MLRVQLGTTVWKRKTALSLRKQKVVPCISLVLHFCSHPVAHWKNVLAAVLYVIICAQNPNDKEIRKKKSIETVVIHFRLILTASQVYMTCKMLQPQLILEYSPPDWQLASDTKRITIEWLTNEYMLFFSFPVSAVVHRSPSTFIRSQGTYISQTSKNLTVVGAKITFVLCQTPS